MPWGREGVGAGRGRWKEVKKGCRSTNRWSGHSHGDTEECGGHARYHGGGCVSSGACYANRGCSIASSATCTSDDRAARLKRTHNERRFFKDVFASLPWERVSPRPATSPADGTAASVPRPFPSSVSCVCLLPVTASLRSFYRSLLFGILPWSICPLAD